MKSRLILNLVLLAIIAVLATLALFEPGKKQEESAPLAAVDENALSTVTLKNQDTITFEKRDGHWKLAAPFKAPANDIRVRQLLDIAKAHPEAHYPVQPENLAQYELDKPKATLILGNTTLVFGGTDPINMRRYVKIGDTLYLVNDDFFHHLSAAATDYVDKKLLPENAKVREIVLPGLKATLGQDGKWTREPAGDKPDLSELATLWTTARAIDVKRLDQPAKGDPVHIGLAEGNPVDFVIVQRDPEPILARPDLGLQYELTGETARQLLNLPKAQPTAGQPLSPGSDEDAGHEEEEDTGESPPEAGEDDSGSVAPAEGGSGKEHKDEHGEE